jgi:hypothetical protein
MEDLVKRKIELLTELNVHYKNLILFLNSTAINQAFKAHGFQNLDQGVMWFQKGIELLESPQQSQPSSIDKVLDTKPIESGAIFDELIEA